MPGIDHESLVILFREEPRVVTDLLTSVLHVRVPEGAAATVLDATWSEVQRTERRVDVVVMLAGAREKLCVVVEVQLRIDPDKAFRWPLYVAAMQDRLRCPTYLLVVT